MKRPRFPYLSTVEVKWQDARTATGWRDHQEMERWSADWRSRTIVSVGYFVKQDKVGIVLTHSKDFYTDDAATLGGADEIPTGQILSVRRLRA